MNSNAKNLAIIRHREFRHLPYWFFPELNSIGSTQAGESMWIVDVPEFKLLKTC